MAKVQTKVIRVATGKENQPWGLALALPNNQRLAAGTIKCNQKSKAVRDFDVTAKIPLADGMKTITVKGAFSMNKALEQINEEIGKLYVDQLKLTKKMQKAIEPVAKAPRRGRKKAAEAEAE